MFTILVIVSTLAQHDLQNKGHTEMPDFVFLPVQQKICHPNTDVLLYLLSLNSWWFDDFLIHCKDSFTWKQMKIHRWLGWWCARKQWLYNLLCQIEAVRSRIKTDRENHTAKLIYPNWKGTVQYLAVSTTLQSALLWDLSIQGGSGDAGSEFFYLYIN